ncbi:phenylalanine--tRNA ligase subunit alpha [Candidatus Sumerlaeota bacterium]|nr:phenylalanine--tRNA ligase subunit alpha [Candidatus Sumerlaeota bacterium]
MLDIIVKNLEELLPALKADLKDVHTTRDLEEIRVAYLGKKGKLTTIMKSFGSLDPEERPKAGKMVNDAKDKALEMLIRKEQDINEKEILLQIDNEAIDLTLPGTATPPGRRHPITQVLGEIEEIFVSMGFDVEEGPDIEDDYHNFEALNTPPFHPARDLHDTFYVEGGLLLRTQTSPVQIRVMERKKPPLAIIAPGKVYRVDMDVSHSPMFTQVEGLMVDEKISFGDLKGVVEVFIHQLFDKEAAIRFRPHYFPFTEPSAEVDLQCVFCRGSGCRVCKQTGWLEIMGCGMVHPAVFENVGYDTNKYTGFAFGMGVERITMLKYGINDIRLFYENDLRFLKQF